MVCWSIEGVVRLLNGQIGLRSDRADQPDLTSSIVATMQCLSETSCSQER